MSAAVIAAVLIAGALGALARFGVSTLLAASRSRLDPAPFPWAVLLVNVVGSAIGGAVLGLATAGAVSPEWRLILLTGFCGGLTTFSTFSVESVQLVIDGKARSAVLSVGANLVAGIAVAAAAFALTQ